VAGIEAALAGRTTVLAFLILAQIVVTLAVVGWLSRGRDATTAPADPRS